MTISTQSATQNGTEVSLTPLDKPFDLSFEYKGFTYEILFIKQQIGQDKENEREINLKDYADLSKLKTKEEKAQRFQELQQFIKQAKKVIDVMKGLNGCPDALMKSHSFTFNFTQKYQNTPGFFNKVGDLFNIEKWKWKSEPIILESITYKETAASQEKTFAVKLSMYDDKGQKEILKTTRPLNLAIRNIFNKEIANPTNYKYKPQQTENTPPNPSSNISQEQSETHSTNSNSTLLNLEKEDD